MSQLFNVTKNIFKSQRAAQAKDMTAKQTTKKLIVVDLSLSHARIPKQVTAILKKYAEESTVSHIDREALQAEFVGSDIQFDITNNEHHWERVKEKIKKLRSDYKFTLPLEKNEEVKVPLRERKCSDSDFPPSEKDSSCNESDTSGKESDADRILPKKRYAYPKGDPSDQYPHKIRRDQRMLDNFPYDHLTPYVGRVFREDEHDPREFFSSVHTPVSHEESAAYKKKRDKKRIAKDALDSSPEEPHKPRYKHNFNTVVDLFARQYEIAKSYHRGLGAQIREKVLNIDSYIQAELEDQTERARYAQEFAIKQREQKDYYIEENDRLIQELDQLKQKLQDKEETIQQKDIALKERDEIIQMRGEHINEHEQWLNQCEKTINDQREQIDQLAREGKAQEAEAEALKDCVAVSGFVHMMLHQQHPYLGPSYYWIFKDRKTSAEYFNWRLVCDPVRFYNEMITYYNYSGIFESLSNQEQYAVMVDINLILRSIYLGRQMIASLDGGIEEANSLPRKCDVAPEIPLKDYQEQRKYFLYSYTEKLLPLCDVIVDWMNSAPMQSVFTNGMSYILKYTRAYLEQLTGRVTDEMVKKLNIKEQYDNWSLGNGEISEISGLCFSMLPKQAEFDWKETAKLQKDLEKAKEELEIEREDNTRLRRRNEDLVQQFNQQQDMIIQLTMEAAQAQRGANFSTMTPIQMAELFGIEYLKEPRSCNLAACGIEQHPAGTAFYVPCKCLKNDNFICQLCFASWVMEKGNCPLCRSVFAHPDDQQYQEPAVEEELRIPTEEELIANQQVINQMVNRLSRNVSSNEEQEREENQE